MRSQRRGKVGVCVDRIGLDGIGSKGSVPREHVSSGAEARAVFVSAAGTADGSSDGNGRKCSGTG